MSYDEWKAGVVSASATSEGVSARLWNLTHEVRIGSSISSFRDHISTLWEAEPKPDGPVFAALKVLDLVCETLSDLKCKWLGLLPVPTGSPIPERMFTHLPARDVSRYYASGPIDEKNPPRVVKFRQPFKMAPANNRSRFIWLTFNVDGSHPSDDPTQVVKELGLAHFVGMGFIYRFWLNTASSQLYIPTCLDARLYEAWAPPPATNANPWGLTRDVETGFGCKPELLTNCSDHFGTLPTAELVSPPGIMKAVADLTITYMKNRL